MKSDFFQRNRERLQSMLPAGAFVVVQNNDILPTNADGTLPLQPNSDLYYLTGIEQEESIFLFFPSAQDPKLRAVLFLREATPLVEIWEGRKLTREEAGRISGIEQVRDLDEFPSMFHRLMCEAESVWLNSNEHPRASIEVETRNARFIRQVAHRYPLHRYERLGKLLSILRMTKDEAEIAEIQKACDLTGRGFRRVLGFLKPGVREYEVEAEFAHEFIRHGQKMAYTPIIASGANACSLHYIQNREVCRSGELLLLDVAASWGRYQSDLTRTVPVNGRFTRRQRRVYDAVARVLKAQMESLHPGKLLRDWQKEAESRIESELLELGLLTTRDIRKQNPDNPAYRKYFMHGVGHPIGLDVHDLGNTIRPIQEGTVMTVEPGIYIAEEGFGVRLENTVLIRETGTINLMEKIPLAAEEIESLMHRRSFKRGKSR